jgi:hypothetical protein
MGQLCDRMQEDLKLGGYSPLRLPPGLTQKVKTLFAVG